VKIKRARLIYSKLQTENRIFPVLSDNNNLNQFKELEKLLRNESQYCTEDGHLLKNAIVEAALALRPDLLRLLLSHETLRNNFFTEVDGLLVFDKVKFQKFVMNKRFLPDSYTCFKNKVGLTDGDGNNFLSESREVVLSWPYKDCMLEGGQTKEDAKRNEVFWNEILAPDEINRLTEPKVLNKFRRYDSNGEHEVTSVSKEDNFIIKGNNLLALYSLKKKYEGKIKLIYIDPPYNTGGDGFGYNDNFNHSSWLTFMRNRLIIARDLLRQDGLIFISIDSSRSNTNGVIGTSELPYLNILLDEIFGRKNFISHLHWKKKKQPSFLSRVAGVMESILVYAKNESNIQKLQLGITSDSTKRIDNADNKFSERTIQAGIRYMGISSCIIQKGKYQNKTMTTEFLDDVIIKDGRTQNSFRAIARYRTSQSEIDKFCNLDIIYITASNSFRRYKTKEEEISGKTITDLLLDWGQNQDATNELRCIFNITNDDKVFDNPKPELLISNIIECTTNVDDIILDYHLGSGTTAAVSHKIGRRYIGIEQMDYIQTVAVDRLKKVIEGEQGGISKAVNWHGGGSFVYCELATANQRFVEGIEVATSNDDLQAIWADMQATGFLSWKVKPQDINEYIKEFSELTLEDQKRFLIECLDKNLLYVPYSEINNEEFSISQNDKSLNSDFYSIK